jgi:hypothetical protein
MRFLVGPDTRRRDNLADRFPMRRVRSFLWRKLNFSLISLKKGQTFEKVSLFGSPFFCEQDGLPNFKFDIDSEVLFLYRQIPRKPDFLGWLAIFGTTPVGHFLGASRRVHGCIQHRKVDILVSFDRYALHSLACKIWRCIVHLGFKK